MIIKVKGDYSPRLCTVKWGITTSRFCVYRIVNSVAGTRLVQFVFVIFSIVFHNYVGTLLSSNKVFLVNLI